MIELRLKSLIVVARTFLRESAVYEATHDLNRLWAVARGLLVRIDPAPRPEDVAVVDAWITEWSRIDPGSYAFRYPENRSGGASFVTGVDVDSHVSIRNVRDRVADMRMFLIGCHDLIEDLLELRSSWEDTGTTI